MLLAVGIGIGGLNDFGYIGVDIEVIELNNKKAIIENNKYFKQ
jgi:hypothetical protein